MAASKVDKRVLQALMDAQEAAKAAASTTPRSAQVRALACEVLDETVAAFRAAIDAEDKEDIEAERATDARLAAFDALYSAYDRLYAGLTAGVALATMRGQQTDGVSKLKAYLSETPPSTLRTASFGEGLGTVRTALAFLDDFIPPADRKALRADVTAAYDAAEAASRAASKEVQEARDARSALFEARIAAQAGYQNARDLLSAALRMEGRLDRLNVMLPPYDRLMRRTRSGGGSDDLPDEAGASDDDLDFPSVDDFGDDPASDD